MNKKDIEFITGLFDKLINAVNSLRPSFPEGGYVINPGKKEVPYTAIRVYCCGKCGHEVTTQLIEKGEILICKNCKEKPSPSFAKGGPVNSPDIRVSKGLENKVLMSLNSSGIGMCISLDEIYKLTDELMKIFNSEIKDIKTEHPSPFYEDFVIPSHSIDKVITIRCCMKCGRELAELKLIEPGEFFTCDTCQQRKEEYSQTFEGKLHEILRSKIPPYDNNLELIPTLQYKILHAFNDETKKITSVRKWTDQDMIDFAKYLETYFQHDIPAMFNKWQNIKS